jgi:hypothetical protein
MQVVLPAVAAAGRDEVAAVARRVGGVGGELLVGYKPAVDRGYTFEVNLLGKAATWLLYASLGFTMVTDRGTVWPRVIFWIGFGCAIAALLGYLWKARREVRT